MKIRTLLLGALLLALPASIWAGPPHPTGWFLNRLGPDGSQAYVTDKGYSVRENRVLVPTYLEYTRTGNYDFKMTSGEVIRTLKSESPLKELRPIKEFSREWVVFGRVCALFSPTAKQEMVDYFRNLNLEIRKLSK